MGALKLSNSGNGVNVVLLHGFGDTCRLFKHLKPYLEERGYMAHCLNLIPNYGQTGLDELALRVREYAAGLAGPINLVGFSMGGMVARYYAQRYGGVRKLVTISSPHRGTWNAYLVWTKGVRQMRPGSDFLRGLTPLNGVDFTSIWTPFDLMIVPASSSEIPEARMVKISVSHHAAMVRDERVMRAVAEALGDRGSPADIRLGRA